MQLPIGLAYTGEKKSGTVGLLLDPKLQELGGIATYTPQFGGEGHWSIIFPGLSVEEMKKAMSQYAKNYFNPPK
jgi:hypothetical protein